MTEPPLKDTLKESSLNALNADSLDEKEKLSARVLDVSLPDFVDTKALERPEGVAIQV